MNPISSDKHVAIMARMVLKAPNQKIGRTQLMKLCYFLEEIGQVPLRYDFRLFNYGPFDSEVLDDLGTACRDSALKEKTVIYSRSYGYEITPGESADGLSRDLESANPELVEKIDEIVQAFAGDGAGELELKSTIVFVDREFHRSSQPSNIDSIAERVNSIKPHFSLDTIRDRIRNMMGKGYLDTLSV